MRRQTLLPYRKNKDAIMSTKYFICSIGEPGKGYDDENLRRCILESGFFMHEGCTQRGRIADIEADDILILKYNNFLFAYGRATSAMVTEDNGGWNLKVPVEGWITGQSVHKYGVQTAQVAGNNYETVKLVDREFARSKITSIGVPF